MYGGEGVHNSREDLHLGVPLHLNITRVRIRIEGLKFRGCNRHSDN